MRALRVVKRKQTFVVVHFFVWKWHANGGRKSREGVLERWGQSGDGCGGFLVDRHHQRGAIVDVTREKGIVVGQFLAAKNQASGFTGADLVLSGESDGKITNRSLRTDVDNELALREVYDSNLHEFYGARI